MSVEERKMEPEVDGFVKGLIDSIGSPEAATANQEKTKVIVAVHGIGDQFNAATISSVATRFCRYVNKPAAIPLGRFHGAEGTVSVAYFPTEVLPGFPENYGFAEIYWANVPRDVVKEGYILEESKRWAQTIAGRLQYRKSGTDELTPAQIQDNRLMVQVLQEMIEGVAVLDRLLFVARKAGLFDFSLNKLLNDYLNDVQIVAEFSHRRGQILGLFREAMRRIVKAAPDAEIHVVAHSEGTVVSFLGILEGIKNAARATDNIVDVKEREGVETDRLWTRNLRGYMTIGSPLNKHVVFWPQLFEVYGDAPKPDAGPGEKIRWRNYYDFGDPIGFDLQFTRDWMKKHQWDRFFEFNGPEDVAKAALNRADRLLKETLPQSSGAGQPEVSEEPHSREAARLIGQARALAEKAKVLAHKAETPAERDHKGAPVSPGKAQAFACQAETLVSEAGTKLDQAREVGARGVASSTDAMGPCKELHDHGFTRYYFPGAAHNDYWTDDDVFGHFIQEVVDPQDKLQRREVCDFRRPPPTRLVPRLTSYLLPYVLSHALIVIGVYLLYKAVRACVDPKLAPFESIGTITWNVIGIACLLNGMTVLSRLPVLSRPLYWRGIAFAVFATSAVVFHWSVDQTTRRTLGSFLLNLDVIWLVAVLTGPFVMMALLALVVKRDAPGTDLKPILAAGSIAGIILISLWGVSRYWSQPKSHPEGDQVAVISANPGHAAQLPTEERRVSAATATFVLVTLAGSFSVLAWMLSREYPGLGMKPLIHTGGLIVFVIVVISIAMRPTSEGLAKWLQDQAESTRLKALRDFRDAERMWKEKGGDLVAYEKVRDQARQQAMRVADLEALAETFSDAKNPDSLGMASWLQKQAASSREEALRDFQIAEGMWKKMKESESDRAHYEKARDRVRLDATHLANLERLAETFSDEGPVWPVVLAFPAFLYLWWLSALFFDLTFFWHRYIRHAAGVKTLNEVIAADASALAKG